MVLLYINKDHEKTCGRHGKRDVFMEKHRLEAVLDKNLKWFLNSGIMNPASGIWGVAERIWICGDPKLRSLVLDSFNSFTVHDTHTVIESRRADCNFQAACLFLLAGREETARNLLDFLYFRSGLLNRGATKGAKENMAGVWNWSHTMWRQTLYFDDNSWALALALILARMRPDFEKRYDMFKWADLLAKQLTEAFPRSFEHAKTIAANDCSDPEGIWLGRPLLPHWGSLTCFALSHAARAGVGDFQKMREIVSVYHDYLEALPENGLNASELAYALIGATTACKVFGEERFLALSETFAGRLLGRMDPVTGNIPAEHYEAPQGKHLVDTIYTANWVLLGLQNLAHINPEYRAAFDKMLRLFETIQDRSPEPHVAGCWRGMFDMNTNTWGGGDRYEGGAGSIYSGWTNAPVAIVFAGELAGRTLAD